LEFDIVATNVWDYSRNAWQNYYNHGIHIEGDSLNPPKEYDGIHKGHVYHLTETGKNTAIDEFGDSWTFNKTWNMDYKPPMKIAKSLLNPDKMWAIKHVLQDDYDNYSTEAFGYNKNDYEFTSYKKGQALLAEKTMREICPECFDEPYDKIDNIEFSKIPLIEISKLEKPEILHTMDVESQKAQEILDEMFSIRYSGFFFD